MDDRRRTLAAITVLIGLVVLVIIVIGILVSGKKVLSPVPEEDAIRIIFVSPSPVVLMSSTPTGSPNPSVKSKSTATPKPTVEAE